MSMSTLNLIFQAYFSVVDFSYFVGILSAVFLIEFLYTFTTNWDKL